MHVIGCLTKNRGGLDLQHRREPCSVLGRLEEASLRSRYKTQPFVYEFDLPKELRRP